MTTNRWQQIKEIFHSALERAPEERSAFLAEACSDDDSLRGEVESLLLAHEREGSFIDAPAYEMAAPLFAEEADASLVGRQINHYRILAELGTGGMGEVYLAQDTKLGRRIALKILPASYTDDEDRLHRFQQEARSASALNHPNILTIHEIGDERGRPFIATELIEGQTLRERLSGNPLEPVTALEIILQAASALSAAHEAGIVHRDIKPENIMLRTDGYVKVLDFGLAKLSERRTGELKLEAPTRLQGGNTSPGMVMGTVQYMSPEQARGLEVDERTDIWSLGCVLYEMLAGNAPFEGATPTDVTVSILEREPRPLGALGGEIPAELDWVVKKALRKDREERYQTVRELLSDLRAIKQELEFAAQLGRSARPERRLSQPASPPPLVGDEQLITATTSRAVAMPTDEIKEAQATRVQPAAVVKGGFHGTLARALVAALVLAAAGIAFYKFWLQRQPAMVFQAGTITRLTNHGRAIDAAISPDGNYFVYVLSDGGRQSIWLRQTSAANDTQIVPPVAAGFFGITFSRNGNELYYAIKANDAGRLYRIPVLGGTPVKLLEGIDTSISFSPDGKQFAFVRGDYPQRGESGLFIANADGSNILQLASRRAPEFFYPIFFTGPSWSPDGQLIACAVTGPRSGGRIVAVSVQGGQEQVLTREPWPNIGRVQWLPDQSGLLLVGQAREATGSQIWQLSYPGGEVRRVTNDLNFYRALSLTSNASRFVTIQLSGFINIWVATDGKSERAVELPSSRQGEEASLGYNAVQLSVGNVGYLGGNESICWTPDHRIVFISASGRQGDIWIMNADGSNRKQLTFTAGNNHNPVVSPDGRYIVFTSTRSGQRNVWRMNLDGSDLRQLTSGMLDFLPCVSPDNQWVVYSSYHSDRQTLWKVSINGGDAVEVSDREAINPVVSPDGKQIAYLYSEAAASNSPPNRIGVIPFEGGEPTRSFEIPQGTGGGRTILEWSVDGRSLLYTAIDNNVSNIWSQPVEGGAPRQLTNFKEHLITAFDWSRDGHNLVCSRGILIRDAVLVNNAQ